MKIVIAPDSFKESLTALEVALAIESGMKKILPGASFVKVPMADGGEGTVQSLVDATGGKLVTKTVTGPLGAPVEAFFGISGDEKTAVIEMVTLQDFILYLHVTETLWKRLLGVQVN